MPGPRIRELDDDLLLRIFSKVGCADEIAKLALVCKRWSGLSCAVSRFSFDFEAGTKKQLETAEGVICSVLCRASSRAPGNLKHLKVSFYCLEFEEPAQVHGHWLLWATTMSLTKLELATYTVEWGPAVWNAIMRMKTLQEVIINGNLRTEKHLLLPQALANGLQMARLRNCSFLYNDKISAALLETVLATCPGLTELCVSSVDSLAEALRVASFSLETFSLSLDRFDGPHGREVTVHAPRLTSLKLHTRSEIYFESAQSLRTLCLEPPYELYNLPENLQELKLSGVCDLPRLPEMLVFTPMITELYLEAVVEGEGGMDMLAPLVNLRNVYFFCDVMEFRAGEKRFEAVNVHLLPENSSAPEVGWFKALVEVHKIQSLVVHCTSIVDRQAKTVKEEYEDWQFLFELSDLYPDCVKLVD